MEVILLERIDKLGQMGDVVKVKSGYARNYLLPKKKALRATEDNKRHFEEQRAQLEATNLERRSEAEQVGAKMEGFSLVLIRQAGEAGQLYGSVNARDISSGLTEAGFTVARHQVALKHPIKALGLYPVNVQLHPEVIIEVVANVARSNDEAKTQAKTGRAVVGTDEQEAEAAAEAARAAQAAAEVEAEIEAADEAIIDQAEEIFEKGVTPTPETEAEAEAGADAAPDGDGDAADAEKSE